MKKSRLELNSSSNNSCSNSINDSNGCQAHRHIWSEVRLPDRTLFSHHRRFLQVRTLYFLLIANIESGYCKFKRKLNSQLGSISIEICSEITVALLV